MTDDDEQDPWVYFVHGTSTTSWNEAVEVIGERGGGEFGAGFYVFEDTDWGRRSASVWARRKAAGTDAVPVLVRVRLRRSALESLDREDISDEALATAYNNLHGDGLTGKQLVVGPVSRRGSGGERVPNRSLPRQFKFEGSGVSRLAVHEVITAL